MIQDTEKNSTQQFNQSSIQSRIVTIQKKTQTRDIQYYHCEIASCIPATDTIKTQKSHFGKVPLTNVIADYSIAQVQITKNPCQIIITLHSEVTPQTKIEDVLNQLQEKAVCKPRIHRVIEILERLREGSRAIKIINKFSNSRHPTVISQIIRKSGQKYLTSVTMNEAMVELIGLPIGLLSSAILKLQEIPNPIFYDNYFEYWCNSMEKLLNNEQEDPLKLLTYEGMELNAFVTTDIVGNSEDYKVIRTFQLDDEAYRLIQQPYRQVKNSQHFLQVVLEPLQRSLVLDYNQTMNPYLQEHIKDEKEKEDEEQLLCGYRILTD